MHLRKAREEGGIGAQLREDRLGALAQDVTGVAPLLALSDEDMRHREERRGGEALAVVLVIAAKFRLLRDRHQDLAFEQAAHPRFLVGLAGVLRHPQGRGVDLQPARFLQQKLAHTPAPGGGLPGLDGLGCGMVLGFPCDRLAGDHHAIHAHGARLDGDLRLHRAAGGGILMNRGHGCYSAGCVGGAVRRVRTT